MDLTDQNNEIRKFCKKRDWKKFHTPKDLSVGITTESSELMEIFRFKKEHEQEKVLNENREAVEDELADVLFFTLRFADLYDIDLQEALDKKLEKNRNRYPKEKYRGSNKKYDE
jgi:NTP pyrophosphatase (non-canonical NTP hydrolase)